MTRKKTIEGILRLQHQLMDAMESNDSIAWMELNLTIAQLKSLIFICFEETTNFVKLAKALGVTPPNVTGIVNRLVEQKLVTREENREDRRTSVLRATEEGKTLVAGLHERGINRMAVLLNRLTTGELTDLANGLAALVTAAEEHKERKPYERN